MRLGLIVEDLPETQLWLSRLLEKTFPGIRLQTANSIREGLALIEASCHDIALIDLGLPDGSGLACVSRRTMKWPGKPSIVSTSFEDDSHLFPALQAGAAGYILKDHSEEEVIELLQGISSGIPPLSPMIARKVIAHFHTQQTRLHEYKLTPSETEVLEHIANGLTVPETANALGKSHHTVTSQLKQVYGKLNVTSRAEVTRKAIKLGII